MNKKGQAIDMEIISSPGFVVLSLFAVSATLIGWIVSKKMGLGSFPAWQIIITIIVELIAAYVITARNM